LLMDTVGHDYLVFPQMHLDNILWHKVKGQYWDAAWSHINQKSVDFVLCDKEDVRIVLAIELDDKTHDDDKRMERDQMVEDIFREAELPLLRIRSFKDLDGDGIAKLVAQQIN